jgi:O-antigen/teichoic acid export membrane protein
MRTVITTREISSNSITLMPAVPAMKRIPKLIAKNAFANLMRGGATAIVALTLPHFLTLSLGRDRFAAWSLLLQMSAYTSYLDFGVQTAVARFLAGYMERGEEGQRDRLVSTALALLSCAAALAVLLILVVLWQLPNLFSGIPAELMPEFRGATAVLGASVVLALPLSTFSGVLLGLHRNEYVAAAVGGSRLLGAASVLVLVRHTDSLIVLAACIAVTTVLGGIVQVMLVKRLLPALTVSRSGVQVSTAMDLGTYCLGLTVWTVGMLLISGLDVAIVGHVDFKAVGYYSIAAALVMLFSGAHSAVSSALMTPVAALHASGETLQIRGLILRATRLSTFANLAAVTVTCLAGKWFLQHWVGEPYASQALPIVEILMLAQAVRLVMNPYAAALIATDLQRHGIAQGAVEGVINLICSIIGAYLIGPLGVALGTLIGAVCGLGWTILLTVRRTAEVSSGRRTFMTEGILRPFLCSLPMIIFTIVIVFQGQSLTMNAIVLFAVCGFGSYLLTSRFGRLLPRSFDYGKPLPEPR